MLFQMTMYASNCILFIWLKQTFKRERHKQITDIEIFIATRNILLNLKDTNGYNSKESNVGQHRRMRAREMVKALAIQPDDPDLVTSK